MVLWYRPHVLFSWVVVCFYWPFSVVLIYGILVQAAGPLLLGCGFHVSFVLSRIMMFN